MPSLGDIQDKHTDISTIILGNIMAIGEEEERIAVLIPCLNEELTITGVINEFRAQLPNSKIYVFNNASEDDTEQKARAAGAFVRNVPKRGKGHVVRAMFRSIDADYYILVDGDGTYPAAEVRKLLEPVMKGTFDMAVGDRISSQAYDKENTRRFHGFGNRLIRWIVNKQYGSECKDVLSGYRVFSHFFVSNFPVMSDGFEIETEITLHSLDKNIEFVEIPIDYRERPTGSKSKLKTYSDGARILRTITFVLKSYRPLLFFGSLGLIVGALGLVAGAFPIMEYLKYDYIYKVPLAILAASLELMAMLLLSCGLILDTVVRQHREQIELRIIDYRRRYSCRGDE